MRHFIAFVALALVIVATGCSPSSSKERGSSSTQSNESGVSTGEDSTTVDAKRPKDDNEGAPGYLVDPSQLITEKRENISYIRGNAGFVRRLNGFSKTLYAHVFRVSSRELKNGLAENSGVVVVNGELITSKIVESDGSFVEAELISGTSVVVVVNETSGQAGETKPIEIKPNDPNSNTVYKEVAVPTAACPLHADVNKDGSVNDTDKLLKKFYVCIFATQKYGAQFVAYDKLEFCRERFAVYSAGAIITFECANWCYDSSLLTIDQLNAPTPNSLWVDAMNPGIQCSPQQ